MDFDNLLKGIDLDKDISEFVKEYISNIDFNKAKNILNEFYDYRKIDEAINKLKRLIKDDENNFKILSIELKVALETYSLYQKYNLSDKIYFDTMKCFTRFINEAKITRGKLIFDRWYWVTRQIGFHLFRIGELEYELIPINNRYIVSIHIPSDVDLNIKTLQKSIIFAKNILNNTFKDKDISYFYCESWLLDPKLKTLLKEGSNILNFQTLFKLTGEYKESDDFIIWIYKTYDKDIKKFKEETSLQRGVKKLLLNGEKIKNYKGILKI